MTDILKELCLLDAVSGNETSVRNYILKKIKNYCEIKTDNLGNIIALKKGKNKSAKKVMVDAHMDEVGLIISSVTDKGFLKFKTIGGIDTSVLLSRRVKINGKTEGVIGAKPIHLLSKDDAKKLPSADSLYIDIGAKDKSEALSLVNVGDTAVICSDFIKSGDKIISKALDDRIGCAVLIALLTSKSEYDFYGCFSVQEELGLRGAKTAAYQIDPAAAIVTEGTTAADIADVPDENKVCKLGHGAAISFMDSATVYDREYYNAAINSGIKCQSKCGVTGGNNAGSIHLNKSGVRTVCISAPCRYIHSASSVADINDIQSVYEMAKYMINEISGGKL